MKRCGRGCGGLREITEWIVGLMIFVRDVAFNSKRNSNHEVYF